jgi:hypothetical protein
MKMKRVFVLAGNHAEYLEYVNTLTAPLPVLLTSVEQLLGDVGAEVIRIGTWWKRSPQFLAEIDQAVQVSNHGPAKPYFWTPGMTVDDVIDQVVKEALIFNNGNKTHTCQALGVSIRTLRNWITTRPILRQFYTAPNGRCLCGNVRHVMPDAV